jgi:hypothetical protein
MIEEGLKSFNKDKMVADSGIKDEAVDPDRVLAFGWHMPGQYLFVCHRYEPFIQVPHQYTE